MEIRKEDCFFMKEGVIFDGIDKMGLIFDSIDHQTIIFSLKIYYTLTRDNLDIFSSKYIISKTLRNLST